MQFTRDVITVNVERGITSNQLPLSTLLCLIFFTGAHAIQCYVHIRGSIVVISSVRCVSAVLFTHSLSLSGFFGEIIKTAGPMQHQNLFYLFLFLFFVFSTRLVAMAIRALFIQTASSLSIYRNGISNLLVLLDSSSSSNSSRSE